MDFLDFIRKVAEERKAQGFVAKGGKGSGWFAPPRGTHRKGKRGQPKKRGLAADYSPPKKIRNAKGKLIKPPTEFFRGIVPGETKRIKTGNKGWDSYLFVADNRKSALFYGSSIQRIRAKPEAKILYEGTKTYRSLSRGLKGSMLDIVSGVAERAQKEGFDAVWYLKQTDVGTAILNAGAFEVID